MNSEREAMYINHPWQLSGTRHYTLTEGFGKGVECIDAKTSAGLQFTAVCDRALDISQFSYKGVNLTFLARQGETAPAFYDAGGAAWLRSFFGGLLTTCGPMNIGKANSEYGLHDRFSNTPAVSVCDESAYGEDIVLRAIVDTGIFELPKIRCVREIRAGKRGSTITLTDRIQNYGFRDEALCLLYHTNYGYPLLNEETEVFIDSGKIEPYDEYSASCMDRVMIMEKPSAENREKNFFHTMNRSDGNGKAYVINRSLGIGVFLCWSSNLPLATHCRLENPGDYFLAIEPCNTWCVGRDEIEKRNALPVIRAGEEQVFTLTFRVLEGEKMELAAREWNPKL